MLDTDTKRRIDTARDILVGKVPDPKSQVEQITIALIYKFMDDMDDMDAESEELGGKRKFFTGDLALTPRKYRLTDRRDGLHLGVQQVNLLTALVTELTSTKH